MSGEALLIALAASVAASVLYIGAVIVIMRFVTKGGHR